MRYLGRGRRRGRNKRIRSKQRSGGEIRGNWAKVWEVRVDGIAVNQQQRANAEILSGGLSKIKFLFVLKALLGLAEVSNLFLMSPLRLLRASGYEHVFMCVGVYECGCVCVMGRGLVYIHICQRR